MKFLLDAGHSGVAFDHYLTRGKQSPAVPPGIYEGEFNREVCHQIIKYNDNDGGPLDICFLNPGPINISLRDRVKTVNQLAKLEKVCLLSIHANAAGYGGWQPARGSRVFHARRASRQSKQFAKFLHDEMWENGSLPYPPRNIAAKNFYMLWRTRCPAILSECGFMTNKLEALFMAGSGGVKAIAKSHYLAMRQFEDFS